MAKKKTKNREPVEYKKAFREIKVKVKNRTRVSQYYYNVERSLIECKPGKSITYIERLEAIYVPADTEKKQ